MFKQNKQAFTLIELLVVVLIIGILAAVALPQYQLAVAKSRYATLKGLVKAIVQAQEVYYLANGKYTIKFSALDIQMPGDQLSTSTDSYYHYKWGRCQILGDQGVYCHHDLANIRYGIYFKHSEIYAGMQRCSAVDGNDPMTNRICQADSGLAQPTYTNKDTGVAHYFW